MGEPPPSTREPSAGVHRLKPDRPEPRSLRHRLGPSLRVEFVEQRGDVKLDRWTEIARRRAIALFDAPSAMSASTASSRGVKATSGPSSGSPGMTSAASAGSPDAASLKPGNIGQKRRQPIGKLRLADLDRDHHDGRLTGHWLSGRSPIVSVVSIGSPPRRSVSLRLAPTLSGPSARTS